MGDARLLREKPLPPYEVVRVGLSPADAQASHVHVTFVETRDPDGGETRWAADEIMAALRTGERFMTVVKDGRESQLVAGECSSCPFMTLQLDLSLVNVVRIPVG